MFTQNITITTDQDIETVARVCKSRLATQKKLTVQIKKYERNISDEQRRLYWMWVGIIANELGYSKDELHMEYKGKYLINIFAADKENHPGFDAMLEELAQLKGSAIEAGVRRLVTIRHATVNNMSDYLNEIKINAIDHGIRLPLPEMQGLI